MATNNPVIGIIGGGQLGKMFIEACSPHSIKCNVLDGDAHCSSVGLAHEFIHARHTDGAAIRNLAHISDVLTYELENVDADTLEQLEREGKRVIPSASILKTIKNKALQKRFYQQNQLPTAPFEIIHNKSELQAVLQTMNNCSKFAAKLAVGGYDGKGVFIFTRVQAQAPDFVFPFDGEVVIEQFIECKHEISVIVARDQAGNTTTFPAIEMYFDTKGNLVDYLMSPADISPEVAQKAHDIAMQTASHVQSAGLFAVEMFVDANDNVFINEMAPRPHNSGHHTIEACYTSQYEQLMRILVGLPLGNTDLIKPAAVLNILGPDHFSGKYRLDGLQHILVQQGIYLHLYGKEISNPKRKLGHFTIMSDTREANIEKIQFIKKHFNIVPL